MRHSAAKGVEGAVCVCPLCRDGYEVPCPWTDPLVNGVGGAGYEPELAKIRPLPPLPLSLNAWAGHHHCRVFTRREFSGNLAFAQGREHCPCCRVSPG